MNVHVYLCVCVSMYKHTVREAGSSVGGYNSSVTKYLMCFHVVQDIGGQWWLELGVKFGGYQSLLIS